jgi:mercuric ion transport protein
VKLALAAISAAIGASACCIGPVVFSLIGAGALSAASVRLEPYRPWFIAFAVGLIGTAFYGAYRPVGDEVCANGSCTPQSKRPLKILAWIVAALAAILIAFPYYVGWFV